MFCMPRNAFPKLASLSFSENFFGSVIVSPITGVEIGSRFPGEQIVYALCTKLSWCHIRKLIYIENPLKREFYVEKAKLEGWSVRQLNERVQSMLFGRTAISKQPEQTIQGALQLVRDPGKV